jgi:hypothetical protein
MICRESDFFFQAISMVFREGDPIFMMRLFLMSDQLRCASHHKYVVTAGALSPLTQISPSRKNRIPLMPKEMSGFNNV